MPLRHGWCSAHPGSTPNQNPAPDAQKDQREIAGTERARDGAEVVRAALVQGGGELAAVVDQLADQVEQAGGAARFRLVGGGGRGGHERNKNTRPRRLSRNIFRYPLALQAPPGMRRERRS